MATARFWQPDNELIKQADGSLLIRERQALRPYKTRLGDYLRIWAGAEPERTFLAEREANGRWLKISYAETLRSVERLAAGLLALNPNPQRPLLLLSDNSIPFALLQLAALHIGLPVAPVAPAYALQSSDFNRLKSIVALLTPGLVFVPDIIPFQAALQALTPVLKNHPYTLLTVANSKAWPGALAFEQLAEADNNKAMYRAYHKVTAGTVAKILHTAGSTGPPKGVISTQGMLCAQQQALLQIWPFLVARPPVLVDGLPWHTAFGGNHNFNLVLRHGGTLYIDSGKPVPGQFEQTVSNLREIAPTLYCHEPAGFAALTTALEQDRILAEHFFFDLDLLFCVASTLPAELAQRLQRLAHDIRGIPLPLVTGWGTTETAAPATATPANTSFELPQENSSPLAGTQPPGWLGVPLPGAELKLVPLDERSSSARRGAGRDTLIEFDSNEKDGPLFELRVRGPQVFPGYWQQFKESLQAFDDEGFFRTGDGGRLLDPADPDAGIVFGGRLAEHFKLKNGLWVHTGALRADLISACAPFLQDVIIAAPDRPEIAVLLLLSPQGCQRLLGPQAARMTAAELAQQRQLQVHMGFLLRQYNARQMSSNKRIGRALFLTQPLSMDAGELTEKGYINQAAVLQRHAATVAKLYSSHPDVLVMSD
ncbi:MAG: AMP-binding protein [Gammaproteobacteria bacterium]